MHGKDSVPYINLYNLEKPKPSPQPWWAEASNKKITEDCVLALLPQR